MDPNSTNNNSNSGNTNPFAAPPATNPSSTPPQDPLAPTDPLSVTNPAPAVQTTPPVNEPVPSAPTDSSQSTLWPSSNPMAGVNPTPVDQTPNQWPPASSTPVEQTATDSNLNSNPWLSPAQTTSPTTTTTPGSIDPVTPTWQAPTPPPTSNPAEINIGTQQPAVIPTVDSAPAMQQDPSQESKQYADPLTNSSQTANNWSSSNPTPGLSPLDNPMGSPAQTPGIGSSQQDALSTQNWSSPPTPSSAEQTPLSIDPITTPQTQSSTSPVSPTPDAPTDLSHLIGNNTVPEPAQSQAPETMVIPQQGSGGNPDVPNVPSQSHKGIPAWLIGLGVALLLLVAGASAYLILGVGKTPENISLPAQVTDTQNEIKPPAPVPTPPAQPSAPPEATGSGSSSFGDLQGSTPSQTPQASSAAEILRARQAQQQPQ